MGHRTTDVTTAWHNMKDRTHLSSNSPTLPKISSMRWWRQLCGVPWHGHYSHCYSTHPVLQEHRNWWVSRIVCSNVCQTVWKLGPLSYPLTSSEMSACMNVLEWTVSTLQILPLKCWHPYNQGTFFKFLVLKGVCSIVVLLYGTITASGNCSMLCDCFPCISPLKLTSVTCASWL